jgi:hypothetical protein
VAALVAVLTGGTAASLDTFREAAVLIVALFVGATVICAAMLTKRVPLQLPASAEPVARPVAQPVGSPS